MKCNKILTSGGFWGGTLHTGKKNEKKKIFLSKKGLKIFPGDAIYGPAGCGLSSCFMFISESQTCVYMCHCVYELFVTLCSVIS